MAHSTLMALITMPSPTSLAEISIWRPPMKGGQSDDRGDRDVGPVAVASGYETSRISPMTERNLVDPRQG